MTAAGEPALKTIRIGAVEKNQHSFWDAENAGWDDACHKLGMTVSVTAPRSENLAEQRAMMQAHLDDGVDALAFVATQSDAFDDIVSRARQQGVVVVCFDLDAPDSGRLCYVGMDDPHTMGRWAADHMVGLLGSGPKTIGVQAGSTKAAGAKGKLGGFVERMTELGNTIVGGADDGEDLALCRANCRALIESNPGLDGLYGTYSYHTCVQGQTVKDMGLDPKPVVFGWDVLPETIELIQDGSVEMAVWIKEYYFGFYAACAIANLVRLGSEQGLELMGMEPLELAGNQLCPKAELVTQANVQSFIEWRRSVGLEGRLTRLQSGSPTDRNCPQHHE